MAERWQKGERPLAEEFLARHPQLWDRPEVALDLIFEELCLRQEHGQAIDAAGLLRRFPRWREQLQVLLDCHRILGPSPATAFRVM